MEKEEKAKKEKKFGCKGLLIGFFAGALVGGTIYAFRKPIVAKSKQFGSAIMGGLIKKKPVATTVTGIGDTIPEVKPEVTSASTNGGNGYKNGGYRSLNSHQRVNNVNL